MCFQDRPHHGPGQRNREPRPGATYVAVLGIERLGVLDPILSLTLVIHAVGTEAPQDSQMLYPLPAGRSLTFSPIESGSEEKGKLIAMVGPHGGWTEVLCKVGRMLELVEVDGGMGTWVTGAQGNRWEHLLWVSHTT